MAKETTEKKLYDLLVTRDYENFQALESRTGKVPTNPQNGAQDVSRADMFVFDWNSSRGKHYGTAVILLTPEHELELYFGDNLGKTMEDPDDKNEWFAFMEQLRHFATRTNFNGFRPLNINQLRHSLQGQAAIKEGLFESWQGRKNMSWSAGPTEARLMIKHKRNLDETDARHLYIESLFIETAEGERYKLPFNKLTGGRAMLEHVRQGGRPYDIRGQHITDIVEELNVLGRFERSVARETVLEGDTAQLVSEAAVYRKSLKENLKRLGTGRGYATYFESWNPVELTEQDVVIESLKHMFVKQTLDARIEQALPVLARIQQQGNAMKEANIFEAWADRLVEGTWSTPDSPEAQQKLLDLMSKELPVGADATNATEQLYDLLGDDKLFDLLESLAQQDPNADCRQVILDRMQELSDNPDVREVLEQLNIDADATMNPPESMPADLDDEEQAMAEAMFPGSAVGDKLRGMKSAIGRTAGDALKGAMVAAPAAGAGASAGSAMGVAGSSALFAPALGAGALGGAAAALGGFLTYKGLNWLAQKLFGTKEEALAFANAHLKAAGSGQPQFEFQGKTYPVKIKSPQEAQQLMGKIYDLQSQLAEDTAIKSLRRAAGLTEGRMLDEDKSKLDHILDRFKYEVRSFEQGGDLDDDLYDALFDYYMDTGDMPYGTAKARDGDPYEWVAQNLESHLRGGGIIGGVPDEDYSLERESAGNYAPEEMRAPHTVDGGMDNAILYDDSTCNMSEAGEHCPTHGLDECYSESTIPVPMEEKSPLAGIYGHSGKMQEVGKDTSFLDRLKTLSGMRQA